MSSLVTIFIHIAFKSRGTGSYLINKLFHLLAISCSVCSLDEFP